MAKISLVFLILIGCPSSPRVYRLQKISGPKPKEPFFLYVELTRLDSNRVTIWNQCKHSEFEIQRDNGTGFSKLAEYKTRTENSPHCILFPYVDKLDASKNSRYRAFPIADGIKLAEMPTIYETNDSLLYKEIEEGKVPKSLNGIEID